MKDRLNIEQLRPWIEHSMASRENVLATSNQGTILLYRHEGQEVIIKTAMGTFGVYEASVIDPQWPDPL